MGDVHKCTKEGTLERHEVQIQQLIKSVDNLDKIYDLIYGLTTSMSVMTTTMTGFTDDINQIKIDVKEIKDSDLSANVSVLSEQMVRNTKDIASTQTDVKIIQNKDGADFIHYKRVVIGFVIVTILGFVFAAIKLL